MPAGSRSSTGPSGAVVLAVWAVGAVLVFALAAILGMLPIQGSALVGAVALLVAAAAIHLWDMGRGAALLSPHQIVFAIWELYVAGGMFAYALREALWFNYYGDIWGAFGVSVVACASLWVGYLLAARGRVVRPKQVVIDFEPVVWSRLLSAAVVLAGTGWAGAVLMYVQTGVLPAFGGKVDADRVLFSQTASGFVLPMIMCGILAIGLCAAIIADASAPAGRKALASVVALAAAPPLLVYGGRFFVVLPFLIVMLIWTWSLRLDLRVLMLPLAGAAAVVVSMRLVVLRIYGGAATSAQAFRGTLNDLFPEVRSFAIALHTVPREGLWLNIVGSVGTGLIPGRVAELLGIDKQALFAPIGGVVLSSMSAFYGNKILGIRIGVAGEFYLAFGIAGAVFIGLAVGVLAHVADRMWAVRTPGSIAVCAVFTSALAALLPYGSVFIITCVTLTVPVWLAVRWATGPRARLAIVPGSGNRNRGSSWKH